MPSYAQNTISGVIKNADNELVRNSEIELYLQSDRAISFKTKTDERGKFQITVSVMPPYLFIIKAQGYLELVMPLISNNENILVVKKNEKKYKQEARYREIVKRAKKAEKAAAQMQREMQIMIADHRNEIAQLQQSQSSKVQKLENRIEELENYISSTTTMAQSLGNNLAVVEKNLFDEEVKAEELDRDLASARRKLDEHTNYLALQAKEITGLEDIVKRAYMDVNNCKCTYADGRSNITIQFTLVDIDNKVVSTDVPVVISSYRKKNMREKEVLLNDTEVTVPGNSYNYSITLNSKNNFTQSTNALRNNYGIEIRHKDFPKPMTPLEIVDLLKECKIRS
jgi:hypothetical protein